MFNPVEGDHEYVKLPELLPDNVTLLPRYIDTLDEGKTLIGGGLITVTVTDNEADEFIHPIEFVPVTVYVVVDAGLANTDEPDVMFKPIDGDQIKFSAPLTVRLAEPPKHIVASGDSVKVIALF